ncbi:hypothetical protein GCM10027564_28290 [Luteimonas notoginsengisoli]
MIVVAPRPVGPMCAGPVAGPERNANLMMASRASVRDAAAIARNAAIQGASRTAEVPPRAGFPDSKDWEATA